MTVRNILLMAGVLLTGIAIIPWLRDPMATGDSQDIVATGPQTQPGFNDPGPLAAYDDIIRRPVFVSSRRPVATPALKHGQTGEVLLLDRYPVVGVVIAGQQRLVLIRKAAGDTVSRIEQGAELDGWTLTEVSRERLVLEKSGNRKEVSLKNNGGSAD